MPTVINCTDHLIISRTRGSYNEGCWYYNPNPEKLKQWIMGTDSVPLIALATGEVMAFLTILGHFISCEVRAAQILVNFNAPYIFILKIYWRRSRVDSQDPDSTHLEDVVPRRSPIIMYSNIILRIGMFAASCIHLLRRLNIYPFASFTHLPATGLYPLVSCLMNISISVLDIWADNVCIPPSYVSFLARLTLSS